MAHQTQNATGSTRDKSACLAFNEGGCAHGDECWFKHVKLDPSQLEILRAKSAETRRLKSQAREKRREKWLEAKKRAAGGASKEGAGPKDRKAAAIPQHAPSSPPTKERVINGAIIAQITNTVNRVMVAMDLGDGDRFANCFTEDGKVSVNLASKARGGKLWQEYSTRSEIAGLGVALHNKFAECQHWEGNVSVWPGSENNTLRNVSYWKSLRGGEVQSTGIHEDVFINVRGNWLIRERKIHYTFSKEMNTIDNKCHVAL